MDRTERFYRIQRLLRGGRVITIDTFLDDLEVSRATFKRDMEYLRSRMQVPIVWDREAGGYRLEADDTDELPGLWFSAAEAHALLTMHHLLEQLDPGMLDPHLSPLSARLEKLLGSRGHAVDEVRRRIRVLHAARRRVDLSQFEALAQGLLERRRLAIRHFNRATGESHPREVSPQRLVFYRDNWYLDAWCHLRHGLRSFAVDAIESATLLETPADTVDEASLERELSSGYGIFSGGDVRWATLRFTPARARWVAAEEWHPAQRSRVEADGSYHLELPFSDPRELVMDILKHGAEVEVIAPDDLRARVASELSEALATYGAQLPRR